MRSKVCKMWDMQLWTSHASLVSISLSLPLLDASTSNMEHPHLLSSAPLLFLSLLLLLLLLLYLFHHLFHHLISPPVSKRHFVPTNQPCSNPTSRVQSRSHSASQIRTPQGPNRDTQELKTSERQPHQPPQTRENTRTPPLKHTPRSLDPSPLLNFKNDKQHMKQMRFGRCHSTKRVSDPRNPSQGRGSSLTDWLACLLACQQTNGRQIAE